MADKRCCWTCHRQYDKDTLVFGMCSWDHEIPREIQAGEADKGCTKYVKRRSREVKLTGMEIGEVTRIGCARRMTAIARGMKDKGKKNDWTADIEGAAGELVVAKVLGIYFEPTNMKTGAADMGILEVKTSPADEFAVYPSVKPDWIIVGVKGQIPDFQVMGWITGKECLEKPKFQKLYKEAHWIKWADLHPFDAAKLKEAAHGRREEHKVAGPAGPEQEGSGREGEQLEVPPRSMDH